MDNITFLEFEDLSKLDVLNTYGTLCSTTDFNILLGGNIHKGLYTSDGINLYNRATIYYTKTDDLGNVLVSSEKFNSYDPLELFSSRPVIKYNCLDDYSSKLILSRNGICEIEYGHYPQMIVDKIHSDNLERLYNLNKLNRTSNKYNASNENITNYYLEEYEYLGNRYVRFVADEISCKNGYLLSNGSKIKEGVAYWIKVEPIRWLVDSKTKTLISKKALFSNVAFNNRKYYGDFKDTLIYKCLNNEFKKEILQNTFLNKTNILKSIGFDIKKYNLSFEDVSEEEIIRGCIESDIPVFLHGRSSEGKSARVKQIDPDLTIIYLRNSNEGTLCGKSVYNQETGELIDIKPTWLKKLESKCEREPDKIHILFFDEITNALPSIQGMAFNIVLDKEVNGIWKLPSNVRIVASGNEINDSLSANQLAEPLFNRFAHVYIETKVDKWLEWANENNIHPAIYAFIAYKKKEALRSKYDGEKPNADPRKWEMASKMLYKTKNPEMLRSLIGNDITREFVAFCNQRVITLNDVLSGNYNEEDLNLNASEKYSTIIGLLGVSKEDYSIVKEFVSLFGSEFETIFNSLWSKDDPEKLEIIYEYSLGGDSLCLGI